MTLAWCKQIQHIPLYKIKRTLNKIQDLVEAMVEGEVVAEEEVDLGVVAKDLNANYVAKLVMW